MEEGEAGMVTWDDVPSPEKSDDSVENRDSIKTQSQQAVADLMRATYTILT